MPQLLQHAPKDSAKYCQCDAPDNAENDTAFVFGGGMRDFLA
jgi:hypothetical protein